MTAQTARETPRLLAHLWRVDRVGLVLAVLVGVALVAGIVAVWAP